MASTLVNVTDADWKTKVLGGAKPVVVEFWSDG
jgi:hypothetical protein